MLVATPGQTTSYPLHSNSSSTSNAPTKICHSNSSAPPQKPTNSSGNVNGTNNCNSSNTLNVHTVARPVVSKLTESSSALMKTLSVRLNRGTEFLKGTVQKALISNVNSTNSIITTTTSNAAVTSSFKSNYQNRANNTTVVTAAAAGTNFAAATTKRNVSAAAAALSSARISTAATAATAGPTTVTLTPKKTAVLSTASTNVTLYTVPPTVIHRYPEERQQTTSTDSLHKEMCHFKPIRSVPTTPWKCSSKSRGGAVLKRPKASLATKFNYNCDDPKAKYSRCSENSSTAASTYANADADELLSCQFYKPKPSSTLLTTIISTPSHQSAFVCLVAQMKSLVNIQTTKQANSTTGKMLELYKTRRGRGHPKASATSSISIQQIKKSPSINVPLTQLFLRSRKQPFVQVKKINLPTELIIKKRVRGTRAKGISKDTNAAGSGCKTVKQSKNTVSKSKLKETKSKMIDIVAFAQENSTKNSKKSKSDSFVGEFSGESPTEFKRKQRKRKYADTQIGDKAENEDLGGDSETDDAGASASESSLVPSPRKSARLSKDCRNEVLQITSVKKITLRKRKPHGVAKRTVECFSPPLTRSRLKQMMHLDNVTRQRIA